MYLWIDPWIRKLGYALIKPDLLIEDAGILLLDKKKPTRTDNFHKIYEIQQFFEKIIKNYDIKNICIEKLFFTNKNQANAEFVFGVRAVLSVLFIKNNISFCEYAPVHIKKYITGNGSANKDLVQRFVMNIFNLESIPEYHDAADALALAYIASFKKK